MTSRGTSLPTVYQALSKTARAARHATVEDAAIICGRSASWVRSRLRQVGHSYNRDRPLLLPVLRRLFWLALLEDWTRDLRVPSLTKSVRPAFQKGHLPDPFTVFLKPSHLTPRLSFLTRSNASRTSANAPDASATPPSNSSPRNPSRPPR